MSVIPPPRELEPADAVELATVPRSTLDKLLRASAERDRYREGIEKALAWMPDTLTTASAPEAAAGVNAARDILRAAVGQ